MNNRPGVEADIPQNFNLSFKLGCQPLIVGVQESNPVPFCLPDSTVSGSLRPGPVIKANASDSAVGDSLNGFDSVIRRTVIHHDYFQRGKRLVQH
ncbi:hypothetical protein GHYDROH2_00980 [Geobacter hydrogenophilus]|uniref:Uncharacterized protein n=1 Tax=Geobacter hydrogenophilus TaxID=40983 RepID=A0A9W6L9M4_9BACT|nr:hypothetical protein GHYDROH2_00980 [Geobacter hydrogenophilus]